MKTHSENRQSISFSGGRRRVAQYAAKALFVIACAALSQGLLEHVRAGAMAGAFQPGNETITVFAGDCATPRTTFYLGDTVCVLVSGAPLPDNGAVYRRLQWAAPDITDGQRIDIVNEQEYDRFTIPTSGPLAQVGKWAVQTIDVSANGYAVANFTVRDPKYAYVDLAIRRDGLEYFILGDRYLRYTITVSNNGPEYAKDVNFVDYMPEYTTFAALKQASGLPFECTTPARGTVGKSVCTGYKMPPGDSATFDIYYYVNSETRAGTVFSSSNEVWGVNPELKKLDNSYVIETTAKYEDQEGESPTEP